MNNTDWRGNDEVPLQKNDGSRTSAGKAGSGPTAPVGGDNATPHAVEHRAPKTSPGSGTRDGKGSI